MYTVSNTGNEPLTNVVVVDDNGTPSTGDDFNPSYQAGDINMNSKLDPAEVWIYQAMTTATAGQYGNVGEANADGDLSAQSVQDTDPSHYFGPNPGIHIEKATNGHDADTPPGPMVPLNATVTFTYNVTNTRNVMLTEAVVTDDNGTVSTGDDFNPDYASGDGNGNGFLDVGETWIYEATRMATEGQYTNVAEATAHDPITMEDVFDTDPSNHFGSADIKLKDEFEE